MQAENSRLSRNRYYLFQTKAKGYLSESSYSLRNIMLVEKLEGQGLRTELDIKLSQGDKIGFGIHYSYSTTDTTQRTLKQPIWRYINVHYDLVPSLPAT